MTEYATREEIKQLAALQMEFKKELDMLKEGHMDLARRIDYNEIAVLQTAKVRELMDENRGLRARVEYLESQQAPADDKITQPPPEPAPLHPKIII